MNNELHFLQIMKVPFKMIKLDGEELLPIKINKKSVIQCIYIRDCYNTILKQIVQTINKNIGNASANVLVTGNHGIGKTLMFIYVIWCLLQNNEYISKYLIIVNCKKLYFVFDREAQGFVRLLDKDIKNYRHEKNVIRLIDNKSNTMINWSGISILFASSGVMGLNEYLQLNGSIYILPCWTLVELKAFNSLLHTRKYLKENDNVVLKEEEDLFSCFNTFGGNPSRIFSKSTKLPKCLYKRVLWSHDAIKIIQVASQCKVSTENHYNHQLLQMVPTSKNSTFCFQFASEYIAKEIIYNADEEALYQLTAFALQHSILLYNCTNVTRSYLHMYICHHWFETFRKNISRLHLRSLYKSGDISIDIPKHIQVVRFTSYRKFLDIDTQNDGYYILDGKHFPAINGVLVLNRVRYCLRITTNEKDTMNDYTIDKIATFIHEKGTQLKFVFMTTKEIAASYPTQKITRHWKQFNLSSADVPQYVCSLPIYNETVSRHSQLFG